jgi:hypothetical protein
MKYALTLVFAACCATLWLMRPSTELCALHVESLVYDPVARGAKVQGDVRVRVSVDDKGSVVHAQCEGGPTLLCSMAEQNVRKWSFRSGEAETFAVTYIFRIGPPGSHYDAPTRVEFDLPDRVNVYTDSIPIDH